MTKVIKVTKTTKPAPAPAKPGALVSTLTAETAGKNDASILVLPPQDNVDHGARAHAILSMSQAERYMACPGSVLLSANITTTQKSSVAADEGTMAHTIAELIFRQVSTGIPVPLPAIPAEYDPHMLEHCENYVRAVCALPGVSYIEMALDFSTLHKNLGGTSDLVNISADGLHMTVGDLKFGKSPVSAVKNPQLMGYAVGARKTLQVAPKTITLMIFQPRGKNSSWTCSAADLDAFEAELVAAAHLTDDYFAPLKMTDKGCYWCKAKPICPEYLRAAQEAAKNEFAGPAPKAKTAAKIEPAKLTDAVLLAQQLAPWCEAVLQQAKDELAKDPNAVQGYGLKPGRLLQKWTEPDTVLELVTSALDRIKADKDLLEAVLTAVVEPRAIKTPAKAIAALNSVPLFDCPTAYAAVVNDLAAALADNVASSNAAASLVRLSA